MAAEDQLLLQTSEASLCHRPPTLRTSSSDFMGKENGNDFLNMRKRGRKCTADDVNDHRAFFRTMQPTRSVINNMTDSITRKMGSWKVRRVQESSPANMSRVKESAQAEDRAVIDATLIDDVVLEFLDKFIQPATADIGDLDTSDIDAIDFDEEKLRCLENLDDE
jgi:hypothetical protein